jgi:glyoxylase I family protein
MANPISTGAVHHIALTVTDLGRSRRFYTDLFGLQEVADFGSRVLFTNGSFIFALTLPPEPSQAIAKDRFNENRVGLDHLSIGVADRAELERAIRVFDKHGISHGEIEDGTALLGIYMLAFRDPDNIQVELTAPAG